MAGSFLDLPNDLSLLQLSWLMNSDFLQNRPQPSGNKITAKSFIHLEDSNYSSSIQANDTSAGSSGNYFFNKEAMPSQLEEGYMALNFPTHFIRNELVVEVSKLLENFSTIYCHCPDQANVAPKRDEDILKHLSKADVELIDKISKKHSNERALAKSEIVKHLRSVLRSDQKVFKAKIKFPKEEFGSSNFRGSQFRGVSANGKRWQVFIVISKDKCYAG
jgi:prolyl oligopeptidase PreP (S9A serine peptidase family)